MVFNRGPFRIGAMLAACVAGALTLVGAPAAQAETLRVCADPDNMPFSSDTGDERGIYIEIAEKVGEKLSMPVEYVWWLTYRTRRALRNTVLQNDCDAVFALPAGKGWGMRGLIRTDAFLDYSYALIAPKDMKVEKLSDLKSKRIGVQFQTNPHVLLSTQEGYDYHTMLTADELFEALHEGAVDVAFLWGPVAGYELARRADKDRWRVIPLAGPEVEGSVAVALRSDHEALRERINGALIELAPEIEAIGRKYGLPSGEPLRIDDWALPHGPRASAGKAGSATAQAAPASAQASVVVAEADTTKVAAQASEEKPQVDETAMIDSGKVKFNDVCSHCHGANGFSPVRIRDLRRLKSRYDDDWPSVARTTILDGRPEYGMPTWRGTLSEPQIDEILAFLKTIQK